MTNDHAPVHVIRQRERQDTCCPFFSTPVTSGCESHPAAVRPRSMATEDRWANQQDALYGWPGVRVDILSACGCGCLTHAHGYLSVCAPAPTSARTPNTTHRPGKRPNSPPHLVTPTERVASPPASRHTPSPLRRHTPSDAGEARPFRLYRPSSLLSPLG